MLHSEANGSQM